VEKVSTRLASEFDIIAVEDINVRGMTRSAKGTLAQPGQNVRAKAGLNRSILANGWGLLVERLEHKACGRIIKVNPAYTSLRCPECGTVDRGNRKSQAVFRCRSCDHSGNADVNAAINIRTAAGHAVAARGALQPIGGAENREPQPVLLS
jgi:transposase